MDTIDVLIIGAGPAGLATAACLTNFSIPHIILEREDCTASLWRHRTYDRLKLHLAKQFCALPHMPYSPSAPTFIPKDQFIQYLDDYIDKFRLEPSFCRAVELAEFDGEKWRVVARDTRTGVEVEYTSRYLVVATGENAEGVVPDVPGLKGFPGLVMHSSEYKSGRDYNGKRVLVVGSGNSGMEIAFDLATSGAVTSIAIRGPFHVMSIEMIHAGMVLLKYLPVSIVDALLLLRSRIKYGNLSKYGIKRPTKGPFALKGATGRSPVIDVGTVKMIKRGDIQVLKELSSVQGNEVILSDGKAFQFDVIVFATGYKSIANTWLKETDGGLLNQNGYPNEPFPNHWKGKNSIYCAGLSRRGLMGVSMDAEKIANDIRNDLYYKITF